MPGIVHVMASALKSKVFGSSTDEKDDFRLLVTAGPSYDKTQHQPVVVNGDSSVAVENDLIKAKIKVRIRNYGGLPSTSRSHSPYFDDSEHQKDLYSIAFSFIPKQDIPSADTVWGNDFDHPVRDKLPSGFNTAFKIVKDFIDPALSCDAYADEPWLYGASVTSWFTLWVGEKTEEVPLPENEIPMREGGEGDGQTIRQELRLPENGEKRRVHFRTAANRDAFVFEKGRAYQGDFFNPYIDFEERSLKLPGFSLKVTKYLGHKTHCLRYVFKNRKTGEMYFNINFNLLCGEDLQEAVKADEEGKPSSFAGGKTGVVATNGEAAETDGKKSKGRTEAQEPAATLSENGQRQEQEEHVVSPKMQGPSSGTGEQSTNESATQADSQGSEKPPTGQPKGGDDPKQTMDMPLRSAENERAPEPRTATESHSVSVEPQSHLPAVVDSAATTGPQRPKDEVFVDAPESQNTASGTKDLSYLAGWESKGTVMNTLKDEPGGDKKV